MFKYCFAVALAIVVPAVAQAAPVAVSYGSIVPTATEDFEGVALPSPAPTVFDFGPFTASAPTPMYVSSFSLVCASPPQCLRTGGDFSSITIHEFDPLTTAFGFALYEYEERDVIEVSVVGVSGESQFTLSSGQFGFADPLGLISLTITNLGINPGSDVNGRSIYALDDIVLRTGGESSVPAPAAGALLLGAIGLLAMARRRV